MTYHIVAWRGVFRVITSMNTVAAVCASYAEAQAYIDGQAAPGERLV